MSLRRQQELFLDAVEYSVRMVDLAYRRLLSVCAEYAETTGTSDVVEMRNTALVLDAWSMVDCVKRLRSMLHHMPGLRQSSPRLAAFYQDTDCMPELRHYFQHLEDKARAVATDGGPIWGSLSWASLVLDESGKVSGFTVPVVVSGRLAPTREIPMVNPLGMKFCSSVDHITLTAGGQTVDLSEIARRVALFGKLFAAGRDQAMTTGPADETQLFRIDLEVVQPSTDGSNTPGTGPVPGSA